MPSFQGSRKKRSRGRTTCLVLGCFDARFGFYASLGGRPLLREELLEA